MNPILYYAIMVISILVTSFFSCKFAVDKNWKLVFLVGITYTVLWSFCSYHSKRLGFDAMLYDVCVTTFYAIALIWFAQLHLNVITIVGIIIAISGLALINYGS